jgi:hypothetical protein
VWLGPAMGPLGSLPAGGRNWEGFGSDPVLQGIAAAETIKGAQEEGIMATGMILTRNLEIANPTEQPSIMSSTNKSIFDNHSSGDSRMPCPQISMIGLCTKSSYGHLQKVCVLELPV